MNDLSPLLIQRCHQSVAVWPHPTMGREYALGTSVLALAASCSTAFRAETGLTEHGNRGRFMQVRRAWSVSTNAVGRRRSSDGYFGRGYDLIGHCGRRSTAVMMVSDREEELKAKIAKLRGATAKGEGYERVVGSGADLTDKMEKSKSDFQSDWEREQQVCFLCVCGCALSLALQGELVG